MLCFTHLILLLFNLNYIYGLNETNPTFSVLSVKSDKEFKNSNDANRDEDYAYESMDTNASYIDNDYGDEDYGYGSVDEIDSDYQFDTSVISDDTDEDKEHENFRFDKVMDAFLKSSVNLISETSSEFNEEMNKTNKDAKSTWIAYSNILQKFIDSASTFGFTKALKSGIDFKMLDECTHAFISIAKGIRSQRSWAVKFLDSTGRPFGSGSLDGSFSSLGDYDQCLAINPDEYTSRNIKPKNFVGQYCLLKYGVVLPLKPKQLILQSSVFTGTPMENTFLEEFTLTTHAFYDRYNRIGICVPSVCKDTDIKQLVRKFITDQHINLLVDYCDIKQLIHFNTLQIVILCVFAFLALIIIVATGFDWLLTYDEQELLQLLISFQRHIKKFDPKLVNLFSLYTNGKQLFSTESTRSTFQSISGIKVLTMAWILWTHTYLLTIKETFLFNRKFMFAAEELPFQLIQNGWVLVDSFFLIGALLLTTSLLKSLQINGKINITQIFQIVFNRIFRLLPSICLAVMILLIITPLGNGPLWKEYFDPLFEKCSKYWWTKLLFINNWYNFDNMCLIHTWYMSADWQLFIVSLLFVIFIYKFEKFVWYLLAFTEIGACLVVFILTYATREPPTVLYNSPSEREVLDNASKVYVHTYIHLAPYFVGVFLGYVLHKKRDYRIHFVINIFFWMLSLVIGVAIMHIAYSPSSGSKWTLLTAIYGALHRPVWAACVAWVIFACDTGNGGPINTFLSWQFFIPLGKLTYNMYLMHFLVIWFRFGYSRAALPFSHYTMFCEFIVNLFLSTVLSLITYLSVEAPMMAIHQNHFQNWFERTKDGLKKAKRDLSVMTTAV